MIMPKIKNIVLITIIFLLSTCEKDRPVQQIASNKIGVIIDEITDIQYQNQLSQTPNFCMLLQLIADEPQLQILTIKTKYLASLYFPDIVNKSGRTVFEKT